MVLPHGPPVDEACHLPRSYSTHVRRTVAQVALSLTEPPLPNSHLADVLLRPSLRRDMRIAKHGRRGRLVLHKSTSEISMHHVRFTSLTAFDILEVD